MWLRWLPWRLIVQRLAKEHKFMDPVALYYQVRRFSQPSDVIAPIENMRAGMLFHARGLINSQVIQHNLDWVWPCWIERQFNPHDPSFIPRAFSLTHINLTNRNWTAVGIPGFRELPIIDPAGLITPFFDGWSLDFWIIDKKGGRLLPSRSKLIRQELETGDGLAVNTSVNSDTMSLFTSCRVSVNSKGPVCSIDIGACSEDGGILAVSVRPCNPEGVSFIHGITLLEDGKTIEVDRKSRLHLSDIPDITAFSTYRAGDVLRLLPGRGKGTEISCRTGLATCAAAFFLGENTKRKVRVEIPLSAPGKKPAGSYKGAAALWNQALSEAGQIRLDEKKYTFLYEAALRTLILLSPDEVYPGPFRYKRFWFRDAVFIIHALLCAGLIRRSKICIGDFFDRQEITGFFKSQDGEWDSNGQVLWLIERYAELSGEEIPPEWLPPVIKGAWWIIRKKNTAPSRGAHSGLMPAGFSAEHFGPADYYYWDDFWSIAGLRSAAALVEKSDGNLASRFNAEAAKLLRSVEESLAGAQKRLGIAAMPVSPYRRMDSAAVGSLAAGYPIDIFGPGDQRLKETAEFLLSNCMVRGGFFQDMIHSGINPYLTLHIAQVLLRNSDMRFAELVKSTAALASDTGQWPEAVHPGTGGGCMGDGQHAWAAAEWIMILRNCFIREDSPGSLILCPGVIEEWYSGSGRAEFGPAPTPFGPITIKIEKLSGGRARASWKAKWKAEPPLISVALPGYEKAEASAGLTSLTVEKGGSR